MQNTSHGSGTSLSSGADCPVFWKNCRHTASPTRPNACKRKKGRAPLIALPSVAAPEHLVIYHAVLSLATGAAGKSSASSASRCCSV